MSPCPHSLLLTQIPSFRQPDNHPVHALFRRAGGDDGVTYASVGSPAIAAGKIPDVPVTTAPPGSNPKYPDGYDPLSPDVCSATYRCRIPGDIWDGPDSYLSLNFDDGPLPGSDQHATHFYIGINILQYPDCFEMAWDNEDDIAVHTPPYGDSDMRVRAIANEVLGLTAMIWNKDLSDPVPITSMDNIATQMHTWLTGPKKPGLIILEHEISNQSVQAFIDAWDLVVSNGWKTTSVAQMGGASTYQNSWNATSPVTQAGVADLSVHPPPAQAVASTTSEVMLVALLTRSTPILL
ncbi:carbohydrate esterase family 4 protein [Pisolithus tinctorius]|nr:carbohydrate esterase family 4 protein [Pisolithus tinctorius]